MDIVSALQLTCCLYWRHLQLSPNTLELWAVGWRLGGLLAFESMQRCQQMRFQVAVFNVSCSAIREALGSVHHSGPGFRACARPPAICHSSAHMRSSPLGSCRRGAGVLAPGAILAGRCFVCAPGELASVLTDGLAGCAGAGMTALHLATVKGSAAAVSALLRQGASADAQITGTSVTPWLAQGSTALHIAAARGYIGCVSILLEFQSTIPGVPCKVLPACLPPGVP